MKFAKLLARNITLSSPSWAEHFLCYKALKKILATRESPLDGAVSEGASIAIADILASVPEEVAFFTRLHDELLKVSSFFDSAEAALASSYASLVDAFRSHGMSAVSPRDMHQLFVSASVRIFGSGPTAVSFHLPALLFAVRHL